MKKTKRREFLAAAGATTAMSLGLLGRKTAWGQVNETIGVAVVGINGRGKSHIGGFRDLPGVKIVALCDVDEGLFPSRIKSGLTDRGCAKPKTYVDTRKCLDDKDVDVLSIATPNHWHSLGAIWACQAGKDVYVEKPCSHNIFEGRKLVEAARKYKRIVQHGTQCRSSSALREAVQGLQDGIIGDVYMARGLCFKWRNTIGKTPDEPVPDGVHYDAWLGPAPERPYSRNRFHYNWHWHWDYGNGDIGNQGVHQLDIARWGLGVGLPSTVQSMGHHFMFDDDQETPNTQIASMWYPDAEKMLVFEVRHWMTNHEDIIGSGGSNSIGVIFYGSKGYMVVPSYTKYQVYLGKKHEKGPGRDAGGNHYANFIEAVRTRSTRRLTADIEEGHLSSALCHLANAACRLGRTITFDPKTETAVGDADAAALLTRRYRAPYVVPEQV